MHRNHAPVHGAPDRNRTARERVHREALRHHDRAAAKLGYTTPDGWTVDGRGRRVYGPARLAGNRAELLGAAKRAEAGAVLDPAEYVDAAVAASSRAFLLNTAADYRRKAAWGATRVRLESRLVAAPAARPRSPSSRRPARRDPHRRAPRRAARTSAVASAGDGPPPRDPAAPSPRDGRSPSGVLS